jgi:hypothetical protein
MDLTGLISMKSDERDIFDLKAEYLHSDLF